MSTDGFYTVDRHGLCKAGALFGLFEDDPLGFPKLPEVPGMFGHSDHIAQLRLMFPEGLSPHGWRFMLNANAMRGADNAIYMTASEGIELLFEYVRRAEFPSKPSRLQSYFAWKTLDDASAFRPPGASIYRVSSHAIFEADQQWLRTGAYNSMTAFFARQYWSGSATANPKWEVLLTPPMVVHDLVG